MLTLKEIKKFDTERQLAMVRYSPCGQYVFAGSYENLLYRWQVTKEELKPLTPLKGHAGWVQCLAFSDDKRHLFTADSWGQLRCWDYSVTNPKTVWKLEQAHDGWIRGLAVSRDAKHIATCGTDRQVKIWSSIDGKVVHQFSQADDIYSLTIHPDGKSLVTGDLRGIVRQYDINTGKLSRQFDASSLYKLHRLQDVGGVRLLQFNHDGSLLACAGTTPKNGGNVQGVPTILFFDWKTSKIKHTMKIGSTSDGYVYDIHQRPDGLILAITSGNPGTGKFVLQKLGEEKPAFTHTRMANCHSMTVHPNGKTLLVSTTNKGSNGNGRRLNKEKEYEGNTSPLHLWTMS